MDGTDRVTVIVPVHGALLKAQRCVESLVAYTTPFHRVLLIDDASPDPEVGRWLERLKAAGGKIEVIRQVERLGFTATVNRGLRMAGTDDVVLLNSDTEVTPGWLKRLTLASRSIPNVATVTPLSNAAGAFSVPINFRVNRLPSGVGPLEMAAWIEELSDRIYPEVPTGHGYCLYIRREAIESAGPFDEEMFPSGCGAENDFCMRASRAGLIHLIDDTAFVFHHGNASLGWKKRWLLIHGAWQMRRKHPDYRARVAEWLANDPLDPLRERLRERMAAAVSSARGAT
jgi:GT2 family glycosyltransferase